MLQRRTSQSAEAVQRGRMPQWYYVMLHPSANLSAAEKQQLIAGLGNTFGSEGGFRGEGFPVGGGRSGD
ncbi:MAG: heme-binding domain-containing protein [Chloroflexi bacterium]|nr:heme-binding domain-containing protein [Chloroflexota bacterium]MCL5109003.1 heme-binding domain-containing protein [Chloroflexota bacterium]